MSVDVLPAPPARERPSATNRRRATVVTLLLAVSAGMVYGTWLAVDDMRAKPLVASVTRRDGVVQVVNTGDYSWQNLRLTINGEFACDHLTPAAGSLQPGGTVLVNLEGCVSASGQRFDRSQVRARDVALAVTRLPRFPRVNRARTASGTYVLD